MGILGEPAAFVKALNLPAGFSVCELGDQQISFTDPPSSAEAFYRQLGAGRYVAIDGNGRGSVTADLNHPLPSSLCLGTFDLVTDFGTGEHIFDQAQVWRTLHDLTRPAGYIAFDRPAQGYSSHCFYLTDECLFRDLASVNDYTLLRFEKKETPRGLLWRGVYRRPVVAANFRVPQQGRYRATLHLPLMGRGAP